MATIIVPKEYGYVLGVAAASFAVAIWHGARVTTRRRDAKVPYPNAYASAESIASCTDPKEKQAKYLLNCAQRAHSNFLENYPVALAGMLVTGVKYPVTSAVAGVIWTISRISYALGYTRADRSDGRGRYSGGLGALFWLSQAAYIGLALKMGFDLIMS